MSEAAELKSRPCPVCGSSVESEALFESRIDAAKLGAFSYASRKTPELMHHALRLCRTCGDLFASPAPSPEFLAERYRTASFDSGTESRYAAQSYYESLVRLSRLSGRELMRSECCLDVGCGDGAFLAQALADGWSDAVDTGTLPALFRRWESVASSCSSGRLYFRYLSGSVSDESVLRPSPSNWTTMTVMLS